MPKLAKVGARSNGIDPNLAKSGSTRIHSGRCQPNSPDLVDLARVRWVQHAVRRRGLDRTPSDEEGTRPRPPSLAPPQWWCRWRCCSRSELVDADSPAQSFWPGPPSETSRAHVCFAVDGAGPLAHPTRSWSAQAPSPRPCGGGRGRLRGQGRRGQQGQRVAPARRVSGSRRRGLRRERGRACGRGAELGSSRGPDSWSPRVDGLGTARRVGVAAPPPLTISRAL